MKTWAHLPDPKTYAEAMSRPDAELWKQAFNKEHEAFHRLKVMEHGHTIESARAAGATTRPVPMKHVLSIKRDPLGNLRVPTKDNNSDCGTKCQSAPDFTKLRKRLTGYAKSFTPPEWEPLPLPAWTPITELPNTIDGG